MAPLGNSAERLRKRIYQPSIDSFFQRDGSNSADDSSSSSQISPLSPPLPAETQSSLLSVGMRVRKSVPEGYKTHKTMPAEKFPFPCAAPVNAAPSTPIYTTTTSRELAPFCGLHKIGGLSSQDSLDDAPSSAPATFPTGHGTNSTISDLSIPPTTFLSTQGSTTSNMGFKPSNKRSYEEDSEDAIDAYFDETEAHGTVVPVGGRRLAKLRSSRHEQDIGRTVVCSPGKVVAGDFEEAPFLVPMDTDV